MPPWRELPYPAPAVVHDVPVRRLPVCLGLLGVTTLGVGCAAGDLDDVGVGLPGPAAAAADVAEPATAEPRAASASSGTSAAGSDAAMADARALDRSSGGATAPGPRDVDRARFVAAHRPTGARDLTHVAADLDGGVDELVFVYASAEDGVSRVEVAAWDGERYRVSERAVGGRARRINDLVVDDINGDGRLDVVVDQSDVGQSLSAWTATPTGLKPLAAVGGCHDARNTYGVVGARLVDRDADGRQEIEATCDDSPLPVSAWSTDRYGWRDGAYRHTPRPVPGPGDDPAL